MVPGMTSGARTVRETSESQLKQKCLAEKRMKSHHVTQHRESHTNILITETTESPLEHPPALIQTQQGINTTNNQTSPKPTTTFNRVSFLYSKGNISRYIQQPNVSAPISPRSERMNMKKIRGIIKYIKRIEPPQKKA